jgi:hypothetical protein
MRSRDRRERARRALARLVKNLDNPALVPDIGRARAQIAGYSVLLAYYNAHEASELSDRLDAIEARLQLAEARK